VTTGFRNLEEGPVAVYGAESSAFAEVRKIPRALAEAAPLSALETLERFDELRRELGGSPLVTVPMRLPDSPEHVSAVVFPTFGHAFAAFYAGELRPAAGLVVR